MIADHRQAFGAFLLRDQTKGTRRQQGDEIRGRCPRSGHEDKHPSFGLNIVTGTWSCSCGGGKASELEKELGWAPLTNGPRDPSIKRSYPATVDGKLVGHHIIVGDGEGKKVRWEWISKTKLNDLDLHGAGRLKLSPAGVPAILCEGERKSDLLQAVAGGEVVVVGTMTGSSGTPSQKVLEALKGREVYLWPDYDDTGRQHMARIAGRLHELGINVRTIAWDGAKLEGDDCGDFVKRGGTVEQFRAMLEAAGAPAPIEDAKTYGVAVRLDTIDPPTEPRKVSWGIRELDANTDGGVAHRRLTLVIMDTGVGKSRLCTRLSITAVENGYIVVYMGTELTAEDERAMIEQAGCGAALKGIFYIADNDLEQFRKAIKAAVEASPDGKVLGVVDVLQDVGLPPGPEGRMDIGVEAISKVLADIANELDVPMVLSSQVSRTSIKRGMDVHAAANGNVERKASTVLVAVPVNEGEIEITVHKLRWGKRGGKVNLVVDYPALQFTAAAPIDASAIAGKPAKLTLRDQIAAKIIEMHLAMKSDPTKEPATKEILASIFNRGTESIYKHVKVLLADKRISAVEGGGKGRPTKYYGPEGVLRC